MKLDGVGVVITGAAGGLGSELVRTLSGRGARLVLLDRNQEALQAQAAGLGGGATPIAVDLLDGEARNAALQEAEQALGGIDLLLNNAGLMSFRPYAEEDPALLERIVQLNMLAPMLACRQVLPGMLARGRGRIVNIGSTFGTIGFAWFAAYSASKFGLRGFSEALRRELDGSGVGVTYVAPRAVRTPLNTGAVYRMAEAVKMNLDDPAWVADQVIAAIEADVKERHLGWPEKLFARLNALLPALVDGALRKQNRVMEPFARES